MTFSATAGGVLRFFNDLGEEFSGMGVPVTVTIDSDLLDQVNEFGLDVEKMLEREVHLRKAAQRKAQEFYEENRESIDSYNAYVEKHGPAGKNRGLRRF